MNIEPTGTVLIVDDTEPARYAKSRLMRAAGLQVLEAATGAEALRLAREHLPDLVLLDIMLPDIDGFEVCRRLRAESDTASLAIVQISASFERPEHQVRGLEGGADMFLLAPIDSSVLVATVRAMLRLRIAERALRESDRRKDEFLAVLAHELRNPLAPLRSSLELFRRARNLEPVLVQARAIMERQTSQMVRLIDDLLEISRINQNKLELRCESTTLAEVLEAAVETCRPGIEGAGHQLKVQLPAGPVMLYADPVRLAQVFGNLLSNAVKFTPRQGSISLDAVLEGSEIVVTLRDTGIGMGAIDLEHVFEMFVQAPHRSSMHHGGGLGIGLALVKRLVVMHGGSVSAHSDGVGRGSVFVVRLPIQRASAA